MAAVEMVVAPAPAAYSIRGVGPPTRSGAALCPFALPACARAAPCAPSRSRSPSPHPPRPPWTPPPARGAARPRRRRAARRVLPRRRGSRPSTRAELARSLAWLESAAGRRLDIYHYYYRFHARFPGSREREVGVAGNRIPMVSWGGTSTSRIAAGGEDRTITARADDVRRFRHPLFIR